MADDPHRTEPTTPEPGAPEPAGPAGSPGPAAAGAEPDATQRIGPPVPQPPSDATQVHRPVGDETAMLPPRSGDTTIIPPVRPGDTAMLPPVTDHPDEGARWAARAGVPQAAAEEEWVPAEEPGGAWWLPLVLGIGGLLLLALVGIGVWLAFRHSGNAPAPAPSPTASQPASPTPSPTPSLNPSPSASPSAAAVTLPDLRGTSVADAQRVLSGLGLASTVRNQVDDSLPAGSVVRTEPGAGSAVPPGSTVVLVVAVAPATSNVPSPSRSPSPSPTTNG